MKKIFLGWMWAVLLLSSRFGQAAPLAVASFVSERGVPFGLVLDGQALTRNPVRELRVEQLTPGEHWAELIVPGARRSTVRLRSRVWLEPAAENRFVLLTRPGRTPELRLAGTSPLYAAGYGQPGPTPGSYPPVAGSYPPAPEPGYGEPAPGSYPPAYGPGSNSPGYPAGPGYRPMSPQEVDGLAAALQQRPFEATRLEIAKDAIGQTSLFAADLQRLLRGFSFDASRVELAKFAYAHVADPQNFYRVYDAFSFDASVREVQRFVRR